MPLLFRIALAAAGAFGAVVIGRVLGSEYRRVNEELDAVRGERGTRDEPSDHPTLKRDPHTGVYRE